MKTRIDRRNTNHAESPAPLAHSLFASSLLAPALVAGAASGGEAKSPAAVTTASSSNPALPPADVTFTPIVTGYGNRPSTGTVTWQDRSGGTTFTMNLDPSEVGASRTLSSGAMRTCAVSSAGAALRWGRNSRGQLGDGTTTPGRVPVPVTDLGSGVLAVSAGTGYGCALTTTGGVWCWGANDHGRLGNGTTRRARHRSP